MPSEKIRAAMAVFEGSEEPPPRHENKFWKAECHWWKRSYCRNFTWEGSPSFSWYSEPGEDGKYPRYEYDGEPDAKDSEWECSQHEGDGYSDCDAWPWEGSSYPQGLAKMQAAIEFFDTFYHWPLGYKDEYREFEDPDADAEYYRTEPSLVKTAKAALKAQNKSTVRREPNVEKSESAYWMRANKKNSPLLRLPGELRNMIYSKLIDGKIDVYSWGDRYGSSPYIQEINFPSAYKTLQQISGQIRNETATYVTHRNKLNVNYSDISQLHPDSVWWPQVEAFKNLRIGMSGSDWDAFTSPVSDIADRLHSICEAGALESVDLMFWPEAREADRLKDVAKELSSLLSRMGNGREVKVKSRWISTGWILGPDNKSIGEVDVV